MKDYNTGPEEHSSLDRLLQKIFDERGYDFRGYKSASVQRRISKRLYDHRLETYEQYMEYLDSHPDEYTLLLDTLLINVTEFFRDPEAWDVLRQEVLPQIATRKKMGDTIRVWSAGCASGEEAYTIAILFSEFLGEAVKDYQIRIYATDMDESALNEARKGAYGSTSLRNVSPELLAKYFTPEDSLYRVRRNIRQMVAFGRQDLIADAPISHLDLIVCRNVLIYFKQELQGRIIAKFHYALDIGGFIFFGKSESMLSGSDLFCPVNKKWRIFQKSPRAKP